MKKLSTKLIIGIGLSVLGIILVLTMLIIGVVKSNQEPVSVTLDAPDSTFVFTSAGLLDLEVDTVNITLSTSVKDDTIMWGIGRSTDVRQYVGKSSATELIGVKDWKTFTTKTLKAEEAVIKQDKAMLAKLPASSDMWFKSGTEKQQVEVEYTVPEGLNRSLIATTASGIAPKVTFTWERRPSGFSPLRTVLLSLLITFVGIYLIISEEKHLHQLANFTAEQKRRRAEKKTPADVNADILPLVTSAQFPEENRDVLKRVTNYGLGAVVVPTSARSNALRERELAETDRLLIPQMSATEAVVQLDEIDNQVLDTDSNLTSVNAVPTNADSTTNEVSDWKALWSFAAEAKRENEEYDA